MQASFTPFGQTHILVLLITAAMSAIFILVARREPQDKWARGIAYLLGAALLLNYFAYNVYRLNIGAWDIRYDLPMEFCSWATIITITALVFKKQLLFEISYYTVLVGSIQGVITPDLQSDFPHPYFFIFFIAHSGLVISSLYLLLGLGFKPRPGSALKVFLLSQIYLVSALSVDLALDANYGYLMAKPTGKTAIDYLGAWPYYLLSIEAIGFMFCHLLYMPFFLARKRKYGA